MRRQSWSLQLQSGGAGCCHIPRLDWVFRFCSHIQPRAMKSGDCKCLQEGEGKFYEGYSLSKILSNTSWPATRELWSCCANINLANFCIPSSLKLIQNSGVQGDGHCVLGKAVLAEVSLWSCIGSSSTFLSGLSLHAEHAQPLERCNLLSSA